MATPKAATAQPATPPFLLLFGLASTLIYSVFLLRLPLLQAYTVRLKNLQDMKPEEWPTGLAIISCIVFLFLAYALGARSLPAGPLPRLTRWLLIGFPVVFVGIVLMTQPITSTDIYDYLFRGRMLAHYGSNTFVVTPNTIKNDQLLQYVAWKNAVTAYGPLWERMSWALASIVGDSPAYLQILLRLMIGYKLLATLGYVLCGVAIWGVLGRAAPEQRWRGLYLWLWNPLVLWETIAAAHNDVWMALPVVLAIWLMRAWPEPEQRRDTLSRLGPGYALVALTAGGLIKYLAFFFGPPLLVAALRRMSTWRGRLLLVVLGGLACVALFVVAYAPFWAGRDTLQNIGARQSLSSSTWLAAVQPLLVPALTEDRAKALVSGAGLALLVLGMAWATWRAWRAPYDLERHMLWLVLWFLFVCNPWFQPWYLVWAVALVALQPERTRLVWVVGLFSCTSLMYYIVDGLLAPALGLKDTSAAREGFVAAFVYLPPLLALAWGWRPRLGRLLRGRAQSAEATV